MFCLSMPMQSICCQALRKHRERFLINLSHCKGKKFGFQDEQMTELLTNYDDKISGKQLFNKRTTMVERRPESAKV